jgi:hypothetical protein
MMGRFYFHVRANGILTTDSRGYELDGRREAYNHAVKHMPALLRKCRQSANTYVSMQICDDDERTVAVVRGTVILEKRRLPQVRVLAPRRL